MTSNLKKKRDVHLHIEPEYDEKLAAIGQKLWKDQKRSGTPTDIEAFRHAIDTTHTLMFPQAAQ